MLIVSWRHSPSGRRRRTSSWKRSTKKPSKRPRKSKNAKRRRKKTRRKRPNQPTRNGNCWFWLAKNLSHLVDDHRGSAPHHTVTTLSFTQLVWSSDFLRSRLIVSLLFNTHVSLFLYQLLKYISFTRPVAGRDTVPYVPLVTCRQLSAFWRYKSCRITLIFLPASHSEYFRSLFLVNCMIRNSSSFFT